jgi:hypothetical protein
VVDAFTRTFTLVVPSIRLPPKPGGRVHHARGRDNRPFGRVRPGPGSVRGPPDLPGLPAPGDRPARRVPLVRPVRWPLQRPSFCDSSHSPPPGRLTVFRTHVSEINDAHSPVAEILQRVRAGQSLGASSPTPRCIAAARRH